MKVPALRNNSQRESKSTICSLPEGTKLTSVTTNVCVIDVAIYDICNLQHKSHHLELKSRTWGEHHTQIFPKSLRNIHKILTFSPLTLARNSSAALTISRNSGPTARKSLVISTWKEKTFGQQSWNSKNSVEYTKVAKCRQQFISFQPTSNIGKWCTGGPLSWQGNSIPRMALQLLLSYSKFFLHPFHTPLGSEQQINLLSLDIFSYQRQLLVTTATPLP